MASLYEKFEKCLKVEYTHVENDGSFVIERVDDTLFLYFQPSNGDTDWKNNFDFPAKPYRDMKNLWFCHRGFLKVWKSIEPYIADQINDPSVHKIDIVGYSHGGAMAALCYEYVKFNRPDVEVTGVGFGAPRVFWGFAKKVVKERFKGFVVVRNGSDIVTHVPPAILGYRHLGDVLQVGEHVGWVKDHYSNQYRAALKELENEND